MRNRHDRREHVRHPGQTLVLEIDGDIHPLIDISTGGIGFEGRGFRPGQRISLSIYSVLDSNDVIAAPAEVVNINGTRIGAVFSHPNLILFEYVIGHLSNVTDTTPYIIRKRSPD